MIYKQVTSDPGVAVGPFKILRRTDGRLIIYDSRRPIGQRTVGAALETVDDARVCAFSMWTTEQEREL